MNDTAPFDEAALRALLATTAASRSFRETNHGLREFSDEDRPDPRNPCTPWSFLEGFTERGGGGLNWQHGL